jgi:hypothetical protein
MRQLIVVDKKAIRTHFKFINQPLCVTCGVIHCQGLGLELIDVICLERRSCVS